MVAPSFDHEEARRLRAQGWKVAAMAQRFGVSQRSVRAAVAGVASPIDHQLEFRERHRAQHELRLLKVSRLSREGLSRAEIGDALGVHRTTVTRLIRELRKAGLTEIDTRPPADYEVQVPAWVPQHLSATYTLTARRRDEHAAASLCRRLKASGAVACR